MFKIKKYRKKMLLVKKINIKNSVLVYIRYKQFELVWSHTKNNEKRLNLT